MTELEIARNARAVLNLAARLEAWGLDDAHKRAEFIAMNLLADGYARIDPPPALRGPTSTAEGRAAARRLFEEAMREKAGHETWIKTGSVKKGERP